MRLHETFMAVATIGVELDASKSGPRIIDNASYGQAHTGPIADTNIVAGVGNNLSRNEM